MCKGFMYVWEEMCEGNMYRESLEEYVQDMCMGKM